MRQGHRTREPQRFPGRGGEEPQRLVRNLHFEHRKHKTKKKINTLPSTRQSPRAAPQHLRENNTISENFLVILCAAITKHQRWIQKQFQHLLRLLFILIIKFPCRLLHHSLQPKLPLYIQFRTRVSWTGNSCATRRASRQSPVTASLGCPGGTRLPPQRPAERPAPSSPNQSSQSPTSRRP